MHIIDKREFTETDYMGYAGAKEINGHKPQIIEFEDDISGINLILAHSSEDEISVQIDVFQGESETSYIKSFKSYEEAKEVFEDLESELDGLCIGEALDYLSSLSFDKAF